MLFISVAGCVSWKQMLEGIFGRCFLHCSPLPLSQCFWNEFVPSPLGWIYSWFSATAHQPNYFVDVDFIEFILWNQEILILWMCFLKLHASPGHHPHPTSSHLENHCCEPVFSILTTHRSHRKCSTILWKFWGPNLRNFTWKVKHCWSSLATGIRGTSSDAVIIRRHCYIKWSSW